MRTIHKIMLMIPFFIVMYWLFCVFFLIETKFYRDYFDLLDRFDTILVSVSTFHFIFFNRIYSDFSKIYLQCIYFIVILNFLYIYLTNEVYYFIYYSIISTHILISIWNRLQQKKP